MHILIVAPEQIPVPPVMGGSVEVCILSIARQWAKTEQITIISRRHPKYRNVHTEKNLKIWRVASFGEEAYAKEVLQAIKGKSFDWIQVDNRPYLASVIKQAYPYIPVSLFLHSMTFVTPPFRQVQDAARRMANLELVITNSESMRQEFSGIFPSLRAKVRTVLLGVDTKRFRPCSKKMQLKIRKKFHVQGRFNVLFVGRLIPKKGVPLLIKAMHLALKKYPRMRLVIVGGEQKKGYKQKLINMARNYQVPFACIGKLPHRKVHCTYWLGDCFVCPSQKPEPFGLVNVEAMASQLPVIGSKNGGIPEIIKDGHNGFLIQSYQQPQAFAQKIIECAKDQVKCKKISTQARMDAIRKFSWFRTAQDLLWIYKTKKIEMRKRES